MTTNITETNKLLKQTRRQLSVIAVRSGYALCMIIVIDILLGVLLLAVSGYGLKLGLLLGLHNTRICEYVTVIAELCVAAVGTCRILHKFFVNFILF